MQIARRLKWKREQGGALQLEGVEVQVQLDDTKKIEDLVPKQVWYTRDPQYIKPLTNRICCYFILFFIFPKTQVL